MAYNHHAAELAEAMYSAWYQRCPDTTFIRRHREVRLQATWMYEVLAEHYDRELFTNIHADWFNSEYIQRCFTKEEFVQFCLQTKLNYCIDHNKVIPAALSPQAVEYHLNQEVAFPDYLIDWLASCNARGTLIKMELPWYVICLFRGNHAQRLQLTKAGLLNKPFLAYYKERDDDSHIIKYQTSTANNPEDSAHYIQRFHTPITFAIRFSTPLIERVRRLPDNLAELLIDLHDAQGDIFVAPQCCFTFSINPENGRQLRHSLISFLMELIEKRAQSPQQNSRIDLLKKLILSAHFKHDPDAICYEVITPLEHFRYNTLAYITAHCAPNLACYYSYLFPAASCSLRSHSGLANSNQMTTFVQKRKALPFLAGDFTQLFRAQIETGVFLPTEILVNLLHQSNKPPELNRFITEQEITAPFCQGVIAASGHQQIYPRCEKQALAMIRYWRFQLSIEDDNYLLWINSTAQQRQDLVRYLTTMLQNCIQQQVVRFENRHTENFRKELSRERERLETSGLLAPEYETTRCLAESILCCHGEMPLTDSQHIAPDDPTTLLFCTNKLYQYWLENSDFQARQGRKLLGKSGKQYQATLKKERTEMLCWWLSCHRKFCDRSIVEFWPEYVKQSACELNWSSLQDFAEYFTLQYATAPRVLRVTEPQADAGPMERYDVDRFITQLLEHPEGIYAITRKAINFYLKKPHGEFVLQSETIFLDKSEGQCLLHKNFLMATQDAGKNLICFQAAADGQLTRLPQTIQLSTVPIRHSEKQILLIHNQYLFVIRSMNHYFSARGRGAHGLSKDVLKARVFRISTHHGLELTELHYTLLPVPDWYDRLRSSGRLLTTVVASNNGLSIITFGSILSYKIQPDGNLVLAAAHRRSPDNMSYDLLSAAACAQDSLYVSDLGFGIHHYKQLADGSLKAAGSYEQAYKGDRNVSFSSFQLHEGCLYGYQKENREIVVYTIQPDGSLQHRKTFKLRESLDDKMTILHSKFFFYGLTRELKRL